MRKSLVLALIGTLLTVSGANGQEPGVPGAQRREEGTYALLFTLEFEPGKTDEGLSILQGSLLPSWQAAGVDVTVVESLVGTKNVMLIIPLIEGPDYFEWKVPEQDARTWRALAERLGADDAGGIVDRFVGLLRRQSQDFVFLPVTMRE